MEILYIEHNGVSYKFVNTDGQDSQVFNDKCWFIIRNKKVDNVEALAELWVNKKHLGVTYPPSVEALLSPNTFAGSSQFL